MGRMSSLPDLDAPASPPSAVPQRTVPDDLSLLRAYEPILRFTEGELFFPTAVGPYIARCSLWASDAKGQKERIVDAGELTLEGLCAEAQRHQNRSLSLRFVQKPMTRAQYRRWRREPRERLVGVVRFTTTGMFGRLLEAGLRASLLLRGKVAVGLAATAETAYREQLESDRFTYYGRVVRTGGYVCLQYWFFYAMNDWRSTFNGVNDHEGDWEMATVFLAEQEDGPPRPAWVGFSSHDHHGDDLRRRWDDPELRREGDHPVVFPGAGSHSGAFVAGDYVIAVDPPQLRTVIAIARRMQRWLAPWRAVTGAGPAGLGIPFVDYARGDGRVVGPGAQAQWVADVIDDQTPWVRDYRGLWGLDTEDYFGGERAPSGPRYERNGSIRTAWANPLGWAGLLKVPPGDEDLAALLSERIASIEHRLMELDATVGDERRELRGLEVEVRSLASHDYARSVAQTRREQLTELETKLNQDIAVRASLAEELRTHRDTLSAPLPVPAPQAHVRNYSGPRAAQQQRRTRFLRLWAAVSTPLLLAMVPVILLARPLAWITTLLVLVVLFIGVEAFARRRFLSFLGSSVMVLTVVGICVSFVELFHKHWRIALSAVFLVAALALLIGNLGDLNSGRRRGGTVEDQADE
jgi:hypothetical protein